MKMSVLRFFILTLFLISSLTGLAQEKTGFTLGVKGGIALGGIQEYRKTDLIDLGNDELLYDPAFNRYPGEIGLIARYDFPKSLIFTEFYRSKIETQAYFSIVNQSSGGLYFKFPQDNLSFGAGYKPLPYLRLVASAGVARIRGELYSASEQTEYERLKQFAIDNPDNPYSWNPFKYEQTRRAMKESVNRYHGFAKLGIGFDLGGATIDLAYQRSITPYLTDIQLNNNTYPVDLNYGVFTLALGYRLLPLNKFVTAPLKNAVYKAQREEIPFYKNEISVLLGVEGEDFRSKNVFENTYTRYFRPRLGMTFGFSTMNEALTLKRPGMLNDNVAIDRFTSFFSEVKFRPVYAQKHRLGISAGLNVIKRSGIREYARGSLVINNQLIYKDYLIQPVDKPATVGIQYTADYQYLFAKRLAAGFWFRANGEAASNYFAQFGVKTSVLF